MGRNLVGAKPGWGDEPGWWYQPTPDWRARALEPVAQLYGREVERRYRRQPPKAAGLPVICVGNFTAGGTGKTPLALLIAGELRALGIQPAFLTRGYRGRERGPRFVDPVLDTAAETGDEALLLAAMAPTMVARDRVAGATAILEAVRFGGRDIGAIIMDDGLQNGALAKDLSFAVVDGWRGFGNGHVIPAGPLRASLPFQIDLADAVVVNGGPGAAGDSTSGEGGAPPASADQPSIAMRLRRSFPGPVLAAAPRPVGDTAWLSGARVVAYAAIGNPRRFFDLLEACGANVIGSRAFPDHHTFSEADATQLLAAARANDARLVTTAKDHVRLAGFTRNRLELAGRSAVLPIALDLSARDLERLRGLLAAAVPRLRT